MLGAPAWEQLRPYVERALQGEEVTFETRIEYKNGPARDIRASYSPHLDSRGKVRGFVVLSNDISEIRAAERALRRSEHMLERSQSTAHVGSWEVRLADTDGMPEGPVRWSDEMFRMLGYEPGSFAVTYAELLRVHPPGGSRTGARRVPNKIQRGEPVENEFRIVRPDGTVRLIHTWTDFERDAAGKLIRMIGTCQDITERKRAEQELREADRRKDEFLAMLSHELRNPLAPILQRGRRSSSAPAGDDEPRSSVPRRSSTRQVQHMMRLLDDLLDVSRVSQGKIELRKEPVELATLLLQARRGQPPADRREAAAARGDAGRRSRCRWTADPTRLVAGVRQPAQQRRQVHRRGRPHHADVRREGGEAVVRVRDDGIGHRRRAAAARLRSVRAGRRDRSTARRAGWASA